MSAGRYSIVLTSLPTDADQQREQLVCRLASADPGIDIIGMDVILTAEFAEAGWILPWPASTSERVSLGRLPAAVEIARLQTRLGTTMIFITHDQIEVMRLGDRAVVMNRGEVQKIGTPRELYCHPANLFVAGFIGSPVLILEKSSCSIG